MLNFFETSENSHFREGGNLWTLILDTRFRGYDKKSRTSRKVVQAVQALAWTSKLKFNVIFGTLQK